MSVNIFGDYSSNSVSNVSRYGVYSLGSTSQNIPSTALNSAGYIPTLTSNNSNRNGFIASASSQYNSNYQAFQAFITSPDPSNNSSDWATAGIYFNFWIQIKLPSAKSIWKFQLQPRVTGDPVFNNWGLQGSNDGMIYTNIYTTATALNRSLNEFILSTPSDLYTYYRIYVNSCNGTSGNPGLCYWQLFVVDDLKSFY